MNLSRQEAEDALAAVARADSQSRQLTGYRDAAPFLILWGLIWLAAYVTEDLAPAYDRLAWLAGMAIGLPLTGLIVFRMVRRRAAQARAERRIGGGAQPHFGMIGVAGWSILGAVLVLFGPLEPRESTTLIALFWTLAYMLAGAWLGWRLFAIGAAATAAILFGFHFVEAHFHLWMGVVGGGALIAGGLWLRKV